MGMSEPPVNRKMDGPEQDTRLTQAQVMKLIDDNAGYRFHTVGRMPRVKVYLTHLTRFKARNTMLVGVYKNKKAAHKQISTLCNPKPKKVKNERNDTTAKDA